MPTVDLGPCGCCEGPCGEWTEQRLAAVQPYLSFDSGTLVESRDVRLNQRLICSQIDELGLSSVLEFTGFSMGSFSYLAPLNEISSINPSGWVLTYGGTVTDAVFSGTLTANFNLGSVFLTFYAAVTCPKNPSLTKVLPWIIGPRWTDFWTPAIFGCTLTGPLTTDTQGDSVGFIGNGPGGEFQGFPFQFTGFYTNGNFSGYRTVVYSHYSGGLSVIP